MYVSLLYNKWNKYIVNTMWKCALLLIHTYITYVRELVTKLIYYAELNRIAQNKIVFNYIYEIYKRAISKTKGINTKEIIWNLIV